MLHSIPCMHNFLHKPIVVLMLNVPLEYFDFSSLQVKTDSKLSFRVVSVVPVLSILKLK